MFFDSNYTDKDSVHSYKHVYEQILGNPSSIMEIGIQRGGSILTWLHAFPNAQVIGVDCQKTVNITAPRYTEYITNAYTPAFLQMVPPQDIIIDDGSHAYNDILFVCKHYPKLLKKGGKLVIEDIPDDLWIPEMKAAIPPGFTGHVLDLRPIKKRWDDILFVICESPAPS